MKKTIYYWSPCLTNVGTIKSTLNSSIALARYNSNYEVILLNVFGEWSDCKRYLNNNGVKVKDLTFNYNNFLPKYGFIKSRISYILISFISLLPLLILLKKKKPDYIIAHLITSLPLILFNFFRFDTKLILRISGYPQLNYYRKKLWYFSSKNIFKVTCPTLDLLEELKQKNIFNEKKLSLLSDAIINIQDFKKKINDINFIPKIDLPKNFFLSVGRFTRQKNYFYLVNEFKTICEKYPDIKLLIIGDGELRKKVEIFIQNLNLEKNIFVISYTKNVFHYMKKATAFILSSLWEEVGFVIVEAAMSNTTVISSDCKNGPKEFLSNGGGGYLFENNKQNALVKSFELFLNESESNIYHKKVKAKKNCLKFTMFRHQIELNKILK